MTIARILACDCGLASFGWAVVDADSFHVTAFAAGVIRTEPSAKKRHVLAVDDNMRRVRELVHELTFMLDFYRPQILAAEALSFPRSSSSAAKLAMSWAALATLAEVRGLALLQTTPQEVRKALTGAAGASKDDVEAAVRKHFVLELPGVPRGQQNHAYDAAAVALVCMSSDVVRALRRAA